MVDVKTDDGTKITIGSDGVNSGDVFLGAVKESEAASSVANNFKETGYNVAFLMTLSNYSNQPLINHETFNHGGWVADRARSVKMGAAENVYGHKVGDTATGCSGTIAWKIGKTNKMLVVMYSIPYSHGPMGLSACKYPRPSSAFWLPLRKNPLHTPLPILISS